MWPRTFVGFFVGMLLSISVVLNVNLLLPFEEASILMLGLVLAFPIWTGFIVWSYAFETTWKAFKKLSLILIPSVALNTLLLMMR